MNILTLGCSWTADRCVDATHNTSWVKELSKITPEHNFYNFAYSGTSVHHSLLILESLLKKSQINFDKIIFQITNEGRLTYYKNQNFKNLDLKIDKILDNYFVFDIKKNDNFHNICNINYGILSPNNNSTHAHWNEIKNFAKIYYTNLTREEHFDLEHKIQLEYIKNKVDLVFFHRRFNLSNISSFDYDPNKDHLVIQDVLGDEKFKSFSVDEGNHFSYEGCVWEAKYLKSKIFSDENTCL